MNLHFRSAKQISQEPLPGPSFVLRMADEKSLLGKIVDMEKVVDLGELIFNDADSDYGMVKSPSKGDAKFILDFFKLAERCECPNFVASCQAGVGRSQAVVAALAKKLGRDNSGILRNGTYNRTLYKLLMQEIGQPVVEPLVSIVVRVKYGIDRLLAFMIAMQRQRWQNWEVVAVTDGPNDDVTKLWAFVCQDSRLRTIQTPVAKGRWGNPYRQLGIDAARGEYLGLTNDDNYYTPGYIEQMVLAIESTQADLAMCQICHSYSGWSVTPEGTDIGSWIAKTELVRRHPWNGIDADYEARYLADLCKGSRVVKVPRPLFCHN